ncbi:MAG: hypothetical protein LBT00_15850 [Spirochaetaceae bacterium]|nr:hypothetical protein [Spirochaetaceae bacterium]
MRARCPGRLPLAKQYPPPVRHCERSEAIGSTLRVALVERPPRLDCFTLLTSQ